MSYVSFAYNYVVCNTKNINLKKITQRAVYFFCAASSPLTTIKRILGAEVHNYDF